MSTMAFAKYEGLGNDFVVNRRRTRGRLRRASRARALHRRLGIGADGFLLVLPSEHARAPRA